MADVRYWCRVMIRVSKGQPEVALGYCKDIGAADALVAFYKPHVFSVRWTFEEEKEESPLELAHRLLRALENEK